MSLPQTEYIPDDPENMPPARRRRARRLLVPMEGDERAAAVDGIALRSVPTFDFFLFSLLCGLVLGFGLLLDSPALLLLGLLLAPLMTPFVGICLATVIGSIRFFLRSLIGFFLGGLLVFGAGVLSGLVTYLWKPSDYSQAFLYAQISWPNFIVLAVGAILSSASMVTSDRKPILPSVALAYGLYVPLAVTGFGFSSGLSSLFYGGLVIFIISIAGAALLGAVTFVVLGFRPLTWFGYTLGGVVVLVIVLVLVGISGLGAAFSSHIAIPTDVPTLTATLTPVPPTVTPSLTPLPPTATLTSTPRPSSTPAPTSTVTPSPTPVYALIHATSGNPPGAKVRATPNGTVIRTYENGTLVIVLPDTAVQDGYTWAHIIVVVDNTEGWILQTLLLAATPAPGW